MKSSAAQIFGIPNCDTIKKTRNWLKEQDIEYEFHNYKKDGIKEKILRDWVSLVGWEALLNRRGTTWRKVPQNIKDQIDEDIAIELMIENPSIIKRPVLQIGKRIEVGFNAEQYAEIFG